MTADADISVVVVSMNTRQWLQGCLESLAASSEVAVQVVVVDNASIDGSADMVTDEFPHVELVRNHETYGFSHNNNLGSRRCSAPLVAFLNPDTRVLPGSLGAMEAFFATHASCGVAGGRLLDAEDQVERSTGACPGPLSVALDRLAQSLPALQPLLSPCSQRHFRGYESCRLVDWVSGAYLVIRRALLEDLGGWDAEFFMYYEDADLCLRARRRGYQVWYTPGSVVYHYHNKTPMDPARRRQLMRAGFHQFARKHFRPPRRWLAQLY